MTHTTKHTPGPWEVVGSRICTVANDSDRITLAKTEPGGAFAMSEQQAANATLLAAAPAMYEALQDAYGKLCYLAPDKFDDEEHAANWQRDLSTMLAALAQAEGRGQDDENARN